MKTQTAKGGDITALGQLKAQVGADSKSYEIFAQFNYKAQQTRTAEKQQAETLADAVDTLIRVSKNVHTDLGIDALHDAYYHGYLTGGGDIKPAVRTALRSIDKALASSEVAAGDKAALEEMRGRLTNIDSVQGVGDNGNEKPPNPLDNAKVHTYARLQTIIEEEGIDVNDFAALLDADRVLTPAEKALIKRIRQKIGTPKKGTVMQKVVPESDIQKILNGDYGTVRKSVARASDVSNLNTLAEIYYGLRLDFDDHTFTFNDKTYGRIRYAVENESSLDYSIDEPGYLYPYTGRGFLGTDKVIVPEYMQAKRKYRFGDVLEIIDSRTGEVLETYVFMNHWILKGGK